MLLRMHLPVMLALGLLVTVTTSAQNNYADSLVAVIEKSSSDSARFFLYTQVAWSYLNTSDYKLCAKYGLAALETGDRMLQQPGLKPAKRKWVLTGKARAHVLIGQAFENTGERSRALKHLNLALVLQKELEHKQGMSAAYGAIANLYLYSHPDSAIYYNEKALEMAKLSGNKFSIANIYHGIAIIYQNKGDYPAALEYNQLSMDLMKEIRYKPGIAQSSLNIGGVYSLMGDLGKAVENYFSALKIKEEIGNKEGIAHAYTMIGLLYHSHNNPEEAIVYHRKALELYRQIGANYGVANSWGNLGNAYQKKGDFREALDAFNQALALDKLSGNKDDLSFDYRNIGLVHYHESNFAEALKYQNLALELSTATRNETALTEIHNNIGAIYSKVAAKDGSKQQYRFAISHQEKALALAKATRQNNMLEQIYLDLASAHYQVKDYKKAADYRLRYDQLRDSIHNRDLANKIEKIRREYEVGKAVDAEKAAKEKALAEEKLKQEQVLAEERLQHEKKSLLDKLSFEREMAAARLAREKAVIEERLRQEQLRRDQQAAFAMMELQQQLVYNKKLAEEQALKDQAVYQEKIKHEKVAAAQARRQDQLLAARERKTNFIIMSSAGIILCGLFSVLFVRQRNQKKTAVEKANARHRMTELELQSLRAQLNPHFMFNSMNAIQELIYKQDNENSHIYLARFSRLLRMLLENANQPFIPLDKELEIIELYLTLEKLRLPDLEYSIEVDEGIDTTATLTPNMMLQPYIENAIWHGLTHKKKDRRLELRIRRTEDAIVFQVSDNGVGRMRATEIKASTGLLHESKGMDLLSKRFHLLSQQYGAEISTSISDLLQDDNAAGTAVEIRVPVALSSQVKQKLYDSYSNN